MNRFAKWAVPAGGMICLVPAVGAGAALLLGIVLALVFGNPYASGTAVLSRKMLAVCVIGLGAGMNLHDVASAGASGLIYTALSIILVMTFGLFLGRFWRTDRDASFLICAGTAICGGSAIAAIAPIIHARPHSISIALGLVFVLNALALFLFPWIGHLLDLSEHQFGLWSALAIHDTSSVVGAGLRYGPEALETGTTVKLARALWIVPLAFAIQIALRRSEASEGEAPKAAPKRKYPWFILGFLAMAALFTWAPSLAGAGEIIELAARRGMVLTLFLIGANITLDSIKAAGYKPALQAVMLWCVTAGLSLLAICNNWIAL